MTVPAAAHPLGNFTINHLARVDAERGALHIRYFLDIAEIPTFQIMQQAGGEWSARASQRWAIGEAARVTRDVRVDIDGRRTLLKLVGDPRDYLRPGAGGLPILYWYADFAVAMTGGTHDVAIDDVVYADRRIGWKDIVVDPLQTEPTDNLLHYPSALIGTPRRVSSATFRVSDIGVVSHVRDGVDAETQIASGTSVFAPTALSAMFARSGRTPVWVLLTILAAFGLGALHAVEPGHGKALLAVTLVGARATTRQAVILAGSLTFAHTIGVLLLGVALLFVANFVSETIYPWITLVSGIAVAVIGARALATWIARRRGFSHVHVHEHAGAHPHAHRHDHESEHGHEHSHAIPGARPITFGNAVWAAMSGGIAPCPAAIVVLLTAVRLHQIGYGMLLIVIFSLGLACVLTGIGIGVVQGAAFLARRSGFDRLVAIAPLLSACVISAIGAVMIGQGFVQQGVSAPLPVIAGLALAAIAGYALTQRGHTHIHSHSEVVA